MREIILSAYQYNELNEKAKERARDWYRERFEYFGFDEARESLKGFADKLPIEINDWTLDVVLYRSFVHFSVNGENLETLKGLRLRTWFINNFWNYIEKGKYLKHVNGKSVYSGMTKDVCCPFTGVCFDDILLDPIRELIYKYDNRRDGNKTFDSVITDCFHSFRRAIAEEIEYQFSDDAVAESIEINEYEFDESGKRV